MAGSETAIAAAGGKAAQTRLGEEAAGAAAGRETATAAAGASKTGTGEEATTAAAAAAAAAAAGIETATAEARTESLTTRAAAAVQKAGPAAAEPRGVAGLPSGGEAAPGAAAVIRTGAGSDKPESLLVGWLFTVLNGRGSHLTGSYCTPATATGAAAATGTAAATIATTQAATAPHAVQAAAETAASAAEVLVTSPLSHSACWPAAELTVHQLQLLLELLLVGQLDERLRCWDWLLLLVGLLQQSSVEVRQQLMEQRGSQLLQLLYHVLREDTGLGGEGVQETSEHLMSSFGIVRGRQTPRLLLVLTKLLSGAAEREAVEQYIAELVRTEQYMPSVALLVLQLLQSLVYKSLTWAALKETHMLHSWMCIGATGEGV